MKIRMLTGLAGTDYSLAAGDLHECGADEAGRLIAAGFAEAAEAETPVEAAKSTGRKVTEKARKLISGKEQRG